MVVDAQVYGRHSVANFGHQRPVSGKVDQRRQNAAVGVFAIGVHHPLFAPGGLNLDFTFADG